MEFENVFLWNFFINFFYSDGWRGLKTKPKNFDVKKHAEMCFKLKQFYVVIIRVCIRLSIFKNDEFLIAQMTDLLKQNVSSFLIEVTKLSDSDFFKKLIFLRSASYNLKKWSNRGQKFMQRKQYENAVICFRKTKNERGKTHTTAHIAEENEKRQIFIANTELFRSYFRTAVDKFMQLDLAADAVRNLEKMKQVEKTVELWSRKKKYGKAAPFYEKADSFNNAANCYYIVLNYDKTANVLRRENLTDQLVTYVVENQQHLNLICFCRHSRFCVFLLKEEKLLLTFFVSINKLFETLNEQEKTFINYGMRKQFKNLYVEQRNVKKFFLLHFKTEKLAEAIKILNDVVYPDFNDFSMQIIQRIYDYCFADAIICEKNKYRDIFDIVCQPSLNPAKTVIQKIPEWIAAHHTAAQRRKFLMSKEFERLKDGLMKNFSRTSLFWPRADRRHRAAKKSPFSNFADCI